MTRSGISTFPYRRRATRYTTRIRKPGLSTGDSSNITDTTNSQRLTGQRPTANGQRPTVNDQRSAANELSDRPPVARLRQLAREAPVSARLRLALRGRRHGKQQLGVGGTSRSRRHGPGSGGLREVTRGADPYPLGAAGERTCHEQLGNGQPDGCVETATLRQHGGGSEVDRRSFGDLAHPPRPVCGETEAVERVVEADGHRECRCPDLTREVVVRGGCHALDVGGRDGRGTRHGHGDDAAAWRND